MELAAENTWFVSVLYTVLFGWGPATEINQPIYGVKGEMNGEINAPYFHYLCKENSEKPFDFKLLRVK